MPITLSRMLILASGSEIRRSMLAKAGLNCMVMKPDVDEDGLRTSIMHRPLTEQALHLARAKALAVSRENPEVLVLAADQICALGDKILSKPGDHANCIQQLTAMQGKTHQQHSAVCLYRGAMELWSTVETAHLTMRSLTPEEIAAYLKMDNPYQSCGSYHYESYGKHLFSSVEGRDDVILGLPVQSLLNFMHSNGYAKLS